MSSTAELTLKKSYRSLLVREKRVLVRVDYNVPFDKISGRVSDESRIIASLPTLNYLLSQNAKIILIAHLGRPKGQVNPKYSLKPVVPNLSSLIGKPVAFAEDCVGPKAIEAVNRLKPGEILLLENLRFHAEEEKNDADFGKSLANLGDVFIQDAFGAVHRAHASTTQLPALLPSAAGDLLEKELRFLSGLKTSPTRPYMAILGGAKVADKIGVVEALMSKVDCLFIGGAMAYTFLKAKGFQIGDSLFEADSFEFCKKVLQQAQEKRISIILPSDHVVVKNIEDPSLAKVTPDSNIEAGWKGVDIGPVTLSALKKSVASSKTIFWNGPAGIFEVAAYSKGTMGLASMVAASAKLGAVVVVGGGDSVAAINKAGVEKDITFISTGGGASLEFLEGQELPGVMALPNG